MLHLSSILFATVVLHAYYVRCEDYHHMFLGLTVTSLLFHTTGGERIRIADKALAHLCFIRNLFDARPALDRGYGGLLLFPVGVAALWFGQGLFAPNSEARNRLHLALHVLSVVGLHVYLQLLYADESTRVMLPFNVHGKTQ